MYVFWEGHTIGVCNVKTNRDFLLTLLRLAMVLKIYTLVLNGFLLISVGSFYSKIPEIQVRYFYDSEKMPAQYA